MSENGFTELSALIKIPNGTHLSASHFEIGSGPGHLFRDGTNALAGHADIKIVNPADKNFKIAVLVAGAVGVGVVGTIFVQKMIKKLKVSKDKKVESNSIVESESTVITEDSNALDPYQNEINLSLSVEQWTNLLSKALVLDSLEARIWFVLKNVQIVGDDSQVLEWQSMLKTLSPAEFSSQVKVLLQGDPALQENPVLVELLRKFINESPDEGPAALGAPTR